MLSGRGRTGWTACIAIALLLRCSEPSSQTAPSGKDPFDVPVAPAPVEQGPRFSPRGGGFETHQSVTLSPPGGSGTIHYTRDGSVPTVQSPVYREPIELDETTLLRAVFVDDAGGQPTYATQAYVALDPEAANFSSNLPIVVLERHGDAPVDPDSRDLRTSSALFFEPNGDGRSHLRGPATACTRAGVKVRGQTSRSFPQKSWAVELWHAETDDDYHVPVLGMPEESDWVLLAPSELDRSLMRTMLPMDLSRSIGVYAPRTRFVEVFIVDRSGSTALSLDDYLGVYTFTEKIKRDPQRVDVHKLEEGDVAGDAVTGGFVFRIDHGDTHFVSHRYNFQWEYPDAEVMREANRAPQVDYLVGYLDEFFEALGSDDFTNPRTGRHYSELIDRAKWIDHNLLVALTKNVDGLRLSAYFYKERNGPLVAGPIWDFDRSLGTPYDERAEAPDEWASGDGTRPLEQMFWGDLFEDPEFSSAYWDRWNELTRGPFDASALVARVDDYETQLRESRERHFERWPQFEPRGGPEGEVQILRDWLRERVAWISEQRPR